MKNLSGLLFLETNGQIARIIDNVIEFGDDEVELLYEFVRFWVLSELDCLDQSFLETHRQVMSSVHLHHAVTQSNHVLHVTIGQVSLRLQKRIELPLGNLAREAGFVPSPCRDDLNFLEHWEDRRHERFAAELNPALAGIRDDIDTSHSH